MDFGDPPVEKALSTLVNSLELQAGFRIRRGVFSMWVHLTGPARDSIATDSGVARALGGHEYLAHSATRFYYRDAAKRFHFPARIDG